MKFAVPLALGLVFGVALAPVARAQMAGAPSTGMGGIGGGPSIQPKVSQPDLAPSGLPGVGNGAALATGPKFQKPVVGDPTQELFTAINNNDYDAAQDAVSRGANLQAANQFGETPLDLAIALNRNDITFMLLGTRDELAAQGQDGVMGAPWTLDGVAKQPAGSKKTHNRAAVVPVKAIQKSEILKASSGTPDPQAGFLGFGVKN